MIVEDTDPHPGLISVIIPVLHEQGTINDLLEHLKAQQDGPLFEVIVVDGSPTGDTLHQIIQRNIVIVSSEKGRGRQMNSGAARAKGDVLLFLHADTFLPVNAMQRIKAVLKNEGFVGGAFDVSIHSEKIVFKIVSRLISARSRLTRVPFGDQAIFLRKQYFNRIGGFKEIPLMEDIELMQRIRRNRGKIFFLQDRVVTSPRRWEKEGIITCTMRNWMIRTLYLLGVHPTVLARFYKDT